jgi:hypothetical protein
MTTKLNALDARAVTRETGETYQGRPLIIRLEAGGRLVRIRQKGRRVSYTVTIQQIWMQGARNKAADLVREKAERRAARKAAKSGK